MRKAFLNTLLVMGMMIFIPVTFYGQNKGYKISKNNKNRPEAFPSPYNFRQGGWFFDGGITGTFGTNQQLPAATQDTTYEATNPIRPGVKLTVGRYFIFKKLHKVVKYADATIGYKGLWNNENTTLNASGVAQTYNQNNFAHYLTLNGHLNNVISLNRVTFIQNSLGLNLDYRLAQTITNDLGQAVPDAFVAQVNYTLGLGFMMDNDIALIPYIEIPVFNITPQQATFNRLDYYHASYQTVIVGVKVALFRFGQKECPTAIDPMGTGGQNNGY